MANVPVSTIAVLGLAAVSSAAWVIAAPRSAQPERYLAADHPAAVVAWASARCYAGLQLSPRAAKAHAEDVMMVAAAFESAARRQPMADVCQEALRIAEGALAQDTHPTRTGEQAMFAASQTMALR
jgi:hypothetical protein